MNMETIWHRAYVRWYDNNRAGRRVRAAVWGWVADRLVRLVPQKRAEVTR